ncbi:uncharacterized protein LJ206_019086 isoform 2-T2 [Theristicus caerulescens]
MLLFFEYVLKIGVGFCSLLCSAVTGDVLLWRLIFKTLTLSIIWYLGSVAKSLLYFGYHLMETISNYTSSSESFFMQEIQNGTFAAFFYDVSSFITTTFLYLEHPWVVKIYLLIVLGNIVLVLSKVNKHFKNIIQRSAPRLDSYEWQGVWESMGKCLGRRALPVFWNFTPEQVQNPEKLVEHLEKVCCHPGNSRETQITAMCWGLAHAYRAVLNTIQNPQGEEKVSGSDNKTTGAVPTPENQAMPVSVPPIEKKKYMGKSTRLVRADDERGPSQEQEDEEAESTNEMVTTRSLSLSELRDMRKDFSRHPGKHIITWLLRCWDNGASSLELEGREAKQLGSLSREGGIDKVIGKGAKVLSLWRRLLSGVKERYPFKEDVICHPGKWTTMERGIQYLRELAVLEVIHNDLNNEHLSKDPDEVQCTRLMWRKFVRSAPSSYANSLAIMTWKDEEGPTVDELAGQLRQYEESLSSSLQACISAMEKLPDVLAEKLSREFQRFKEDVSYCSPVRTSISAIRSKRPSLQERRYSGYTPRGTLWFYLRDPEEDMRKWDGKSTSTLEARVCELQGKTITKGGSSRKIDAPVSSKQFPRQSRRADFASDLNKGIFDSHLQEVSNECYDQD